MTDETPTPAPRVNRPVSQTETTTAQAPANSNKYLVKTPWTCSEFHVGETVITPEGTELTAQQKDEAVTAAKSVRMKLTVQEVGN